MNISSGAAQDPLNYLQRRITESKRYSPRLKRHLAILIRKAKRAGPYDDEQAMAVASRLSSYGRRQHLEEVLDSLDARDKDYKNIIVALCKMSEDAKRNAARSRDGRKPQTIRKAVPTARTSQPEIPAREDQGEEEGDGGTA